MNILIDTNIFFGDWKLRRDDSLNFLEFVERTGSTIYIPRIVWEEIKNNYRSDIAKKHDNYQKASKLFGGSLVDIPELKIVKLDYELEANNYLDWLRKKLKFGDSDNVLPYGEFTERIANRVMAKRKPFNMQNSNEYKDALVWETVLDVVSGILGKVDTKVVFISNDINAFGVRSVGGLHPELQEDISNVLALGKTSNFYYYESFAEFLSAHYTPIKGIDSKSVTQYIAAGNSNFGVLLLQWVTTNNVVLIQVLRSVNILHSIEVYGALLNINEISEPQDFYILNASEKITASATLSVLVEMPVYYSVSAFGPDLKQVVSIRLEVKVSILYEKKEPVELQIEDISIPVGEWLELPLLRGNHQAKNYQYSIFDWFKVFEKNASGSFDLFDIEEEPRDYSFSKQIEKENRMRNSQSKYLPRKNAPVSRKPSRQNYKRPKK